MKISINQINKLRKITGIGIIDCKNALLNSNGNLDKAISFLKKKGKKISIRRSDIQIKEGSVIANVNVHENYGTILGIHCETDFLSKSNEYLDFLKCLSKRSLSCNFKSKDIFLNSLYKNDSIHSIIINQIGVFKEKLELKIFEKIEAPFVIKYTHNNYKIASLVGFSKKIDSLIARDIAMHVTAMNPISISRKDFPVNILNQEEKIFRIQLEKEKKSKDIINKIVIGKINSLLMENTLINQKFIKNRKITVNDFIKKYENDVDIISFKRIRI